MVGSGSMKFFDSADSDIVNALGLLKFTQKDFDEIKEKLNEEKFCLGEAGPDEFLSTVEKWRTFFLPCMYMGYTLAKKRAIISHYPYFDQPDILATDDDGYNVFSLQGKSYDVNREGRHKVLFLGGSTIQGYGARIPDFSIPSQVERILDLENGFKIQSLNYGVAGWTCIECLEALLHKNPINIDTVVLYSGWNCFNNFYQMSVLELHPEGAKYYADFSFANIEKTLISRNNFSRISVYKRAINLTINAILDAVSINLQSSRVPFNKVLQKYFSLVEKNILSKIVDELSLEVSEDEVIMRAVTKFGEIQEKISAVCAWKNVRLISIVQPTLSTTTKPLTKREAQFKLDGLPWGRPEAYNKFVTSLFPSSKLIDFSTIFNGFEDEIFLDHGHINAVGNFCVAKSISELLMPK